MRKHRIKIILLAFGCILTVLIVVVNYQANILNIKGDGVVEMEYGETDVLAYDYDKGWIKKDLEPSMFIDSENKQILDKVTIEIIDVEKQVKKESGYLTLGKHKAIAHYRNKDIPFQIEVKDTTKPYYNLSNFSNQSINQDTYRDKGG